MFELRYRTLCHLETPREFCLTDGPGVTELVKADLLEGL
jgi:hypothetical protein